MPDVKIGNYGVTKTVEKYSPEKAIAEYVWNGFDADATEIKIDINDNEIGNISLITISDNGFGVDYDKLDDKFGPWMESEKKDIGGKKENSDVHGKNGVGRLSFISFALEASWKTVYESDGKNYSYEINVTKDNAKNYTASDSVVSESGQTGTRVELTGINNLTSHQFSDKVVKYLIKDFCWYLELNKSKKAIYVNGEKLRYEDFMVRSKQSTFIHEDSGTSFEVKFYQWKESLNEHSKYYFIDGNNKETYKRHTSFNNKGDGFYHSVLIKSALFDDFDFTPQDDRQQSFHFRQKTLTTRAAEYKYLVKELNEFLRKLRYPFLEQNASRLISDLDQSGALPSYDSDDSISTFAHTQLVDTLRGLYKLEPKLFLNLNREQKLTFTRFINLALKSGSREDLFSIIDDVINLTDAERSEFSTLIKNVGLARISSTIKLLKERDETVADLKRLVHDPDVFALEVPHLQDVIQANCWIFGEEYNLVAAEDVAFDKALRLYKERIDSKLPKESLVHEGKSRQMDVFATRRRIVGLNNDDAYFENIIIELKAPDVKLDKVHLDQVEQYMRLIKGSEQFNSKNAKWTFILVGNDFIQKRGEATKYIQDKIDSNKQYGRDVALYDANNNYVIKAKTWSTIFDEFKIRHDFMYKELQLEQSRIETEDSLTAEQIVDHINSRDPSVLPEAELIGAAL